MPTQTERWSAIDNAGQSDPMHETHALAKIELLQFLFGPAFEARVESWFTDYESCLRVW